MIHNISILGCGWLGKPLALYLIEKGYLIKGSTTSIEKLAIFKEVGIQPFIVDITKDDNEELQSFLTADVLIVAIPSKNVLGFKNLIKELEKWAIKKVIFISSTSVYPSLNKEMNENDTTVDSTLVEIENVFRTNRNFATTVIRFAGLFGENRNPGNWFKDKKIPQPNGFVNMIHQQDCIGIIYQVIKQNVFGEVFNACSNHHPSRKEYYINAKKVLKTAPPVFDDSSPLEYKIINSDKVQKQLNYTFVYDNLLA
ncbi:MULTISPECIES: NAD(P)-binding domain-containing protein [unclassified Tenacibaculum]|uniref:NAD(P)-binding domain-containing protein n=1 Tax=unclassified Tenacibaculum TaxID=2635139 RepID=UPI0021083353|nr:MULTISPECIES: NAD(P)-binding domain-containing protein [unclassified Tenacibaculum]